MSGPGFIKLARSPDTSELLREPNCFTLLSVIAYRCRRNRNGTFDVHGLQAGEAAIGDHAGMSRQEYRTALAKLKKWGFVTTRTTNRGTIAKLADTRVYDPNIADQEPPQQPASNQQATTEQPAANQQPTTNKNERQDQAGKKEKNERTMQLGSHTPEDELGIDVGQLRADVADKTERLWRALCNSFPGRTDRTTTTFRWAVHYMVVHALLGKPEAEQWLVEAIDWISEARASGNYNPAGRWVSIVQKRTGLPKSKRRTRK